MARFAGIAWQVLAVAGVVAYQVLVHLGVAGGAPGTAAAVLLAAPAVAVGCWILLRSENRLLWILMIAMAAAATLALGGGGAALYGIPHAAAYLFMLWLFGRTLRHGREPFVTRLARRARGGALSPNMERYTRNLTFAWCVFFAAQLVTSALLLKLGSLEAWSLFINVLNLPLLAAMFTGDYVYRMIRYRDSPQASIVAALQAYAKERASSLLPR